MSVEDYMNRTFRDDTDPDRREQLKANMNIINERIMAHKEKLISEGIDEKHPGW